VNATTRRLIFGGIAVIIAAVGLWFLLAWQGPDYLTFDIPARGGQEPLERTQRLDQDVTTIGRKADVSLPSTFTGDVVATVELTQAEDAEDSYWSLAPSAEATIPIYVNGDAITEEPLSDGDLIEIGGKEVVFHQGPSGVAAFSDWWESKKITHLFFSFRVISDSFPIILRAFPVSLTFGFVAFGLAIPGGLLLAFMKMAKMRWVRWPATIYVDVIRGTPLFLQILIVYFGLTLLPAYGSMIEANPWMKEPFFLGLDFTLYLRGLTVLSLNSAAYLCEIFRAGIQSIPKGQMEAARSLGMTVPRAMAYVIIPQTIRRILPTMMSEFILLFKDTALLAAVGIAEMTLRAREVAASTLNQSAYVLAASFYLIVTIPLGRFVARLEDRLAEAEGGGGGKRPPTVPSAIDSEHEIAHHERVIDIGG